MKQTCEIVFVIDRIGGSFKVLSYSSHRFHEKERYEERDQGPMSTVVGERIGGEITIIFMVRKQGSRHELIAFVFGTLRCSYIHIYVMLRFKCGALKDEIP